MSRITYRERIGMLPNNVSLMPFINTVVPFLEQNYGLATAGEWRVNDVSTMSDGRISYRDAVLGDEKGAFLTHLINLATNPDGYSGDGGYESLRSDGLLHQTNGEELKIHITINRLLFTNDEIECDFEGEASDIETLKGYIRGELGIHL
ncbi:MAG TPA: hypothetical protein PKY82_21835 [Pyrinomonadaceae bacterium]|nr:hypothetical protein [Pyrinomonadaceae bacterium]